MKTNISVKLGFTFEYFIPGVLLIIIGGVCFLVNIILAILMVLFGISALLLQTGIEVDVVDKKVRKFYDLFSLRFGIWINALSLTRVELKTTNESQTMQSRGGQTTYHTKTYDIVFYDNSGTFRELNDFKDYKVAVQILDLISKTFNLESTNEVKEIRNSAMKRRKERKR